MDSRKYLIAAGILFLLLFSGFVYGCKEKGPSDGGGDKEDIVELWLTDPSQNIYFSKQANTGASGSGNGLETITVNPDQIFQEMDGFGYTLTGGSAYHINKMTAAKRTELLNELFRTDGGNIGVSYLRVSIGASDLDAKVFSFNDLPAGETDTLMTEFTLEEDRKNLIPVLKEILVIDPNIKILGSPWSAPVWMKSNKNSVGGRLKPEYYNAYAKYFVKYIEEMAKEGIAIDAVTVQNEPLHDGNNPSMFMPANEQANFIKKSLGPAFKAAGIKTKIIIYDHNADRIDYPMSVLNDAEAKQYIDGSAFHLYGGSINDLSSLHNAHPDKNLYFTEQWVGAGSSLPENLKWHIENLIIGASRNWCRTVLEWNLAADENYEPHTPGGCSQCLGAVTITGDQVTRNSAYYIIAHASKFVRPGSKRIASNMAANLPNAAFITPEGKTVVIVLNSSSSKQYFYIESRSKKFMAALSGGAAGTFIF